MENLPKPTQEGVYLAQTTELIVNKFGKNKLLGVQISFAITQMLAPDGVFKPLLAKTGITQIFFMEQRDGNLNDYTIESIKEALGWDGDDLFAIERLTDITVRLTLQNETYKKSNGQDQTDLKVRYMNHRDSTGGMSATRASESERNAIAQEFANRLKKRQPAKAFMGLPEDQADPQEALALQDIWSGFAADCADANMPSEQIEQSFKSLCKLLFGTYSTTLTKSQLRKLKEGADKYVAELKAEQGKAAPAPGMVPSEELIPF